MKGILAALFVLFAAEAVAADPVVLITPDGKGILIENGRSRFVDLVRWPADDPGGEDPPKDPPGEDPPTPTGLAGKVQQWAKAVDDQLGSAIFAESYKLLAEQVANGNVEDNNDARNEALKAVTEEALKFVPSAKRSQWSDVDDRIGAELSTMFRNGKLASVGDWSTALRDISRGFALAAPESAKPSESVLAESVGALGRRHTEVEELSDEFLERLLEILIERLIQLIFSGVSLGGGR